MVTEKPGFTSKLQRSWDSFAEKRKKEKRLRYFIILVRISSQYSMRVVGGIGAYQSEAERLVV